ncbi:MAG TPA: hypothetical protein PLL10_07260, partial [Elusimicrobiales bacterium]|nr:hypothetical protein [Elusimicrobiales bacterium]
MAIKQTTHKTKILLVDDHPVIITAVADLLTAKGMEICGKAGTLEEAKKLLANIMSPETTDWHYNTHHKGYIIKRNEIEKKLAEG